MAHYAFLDENNIVVQVIPGKDENEGGIDWEEFYSQEMKMTCKRTSYNTQAGVHYASENIPSKDQTKAFRKNFAGPGYSYDPIRDAFIPPKPYESWMLDEDKCIWVAPSAYPNDGNLYRWDEPTTSWVEVTNA